ncbi:MAG: 4Fe-4S dicluster domain-containing protein [Actinomycetota bacterium]
MSTREFVKLVYKNVPEEDFMSVDSARCEGCGDCVVVCPVFLWKLDEKKARLADDYRERCLECGACWQVCQRDAISFDFPEGGKGIVVKFG